MINCPTQRIFFIHSTYSLQVLWGIPKGFLYAQKNSATTGGSWGRLSLFLSEKKHAGPTFTGITLAAPPPPHWDPGGHPKGVEEGDNTSYITDFP